LGDVQTPFNVETIAFHGMEKQELHFAYWRYRRSAAERYSALRRTWWRNRLALFGLAAVAVPAVVAYSWGLWKFFGTDGWISTVGPIVALIPVYAIARSRTMRDLAERWVVEEQRARDLFEADAASATAAANLYRTRWPGEDINAAAE
jgi:hypothetical protein